MTSDAWIETVRVARDLGNGLADLLPSWAKSVRDAPYQLVHATVFALNVLGWRENLSEEEMPPKSIWLDVEALEEHFDRVKSNRKREMSGGTTDWDQEIEDPVDNAAARSLVVGG